MGEASGLARAPTAWLVGLSHRENGKAFRVACRGNGRDLGNGRSPRLQDLMSWPKPRTRLTVGRRPFTVRSTRGQSDSSEPRLRAHDAGPTTPLCLIQRSCRSPTIASRSATENPHLIAKSCTVISG